MKANPTFREMRDELKYNTAVAACFFVKKDAEKIYKEFRTLRYNVAIKNYPEVTWVVVQSK